MNTLQAKTKSKSDRARHSRHLTFKDGSLNVKGLPYSSSARLGAFYSAGPVFGLGAQVQTKVTIGRANDQYEREADVVADNVTAGLPVPSISRISLGSLEPVTQRQEEKEESIQELTVQQQEEEKEELVQENPVQRQEEDEEKQEQPIQKQAIQLQEEEKEGELAQTQTVQRQEEEEKEEAPVQTLQVQRQEEEEEEEEPVQTQMIQCQEEEEEEEEDESVQSKDTSGAISTQQAPMAAVASQAIRSKGPGEPISPSTRNTLESRFGMDLSEVRIHKDSTAHETARALKAKAFTHKRDIWLGNDQSQDDLRLMGHETAHVLQQDGIVRRKPRPEEEEGKEKRTEEAAEIMETVPETKTIPPEKLKAMETLPEKAIPKPKEQVPKGTEVPTSAATMTHSMAEPIKATKSLGIEEAEAEKKRVEVEPVEEAAAVATVPAVAPEAETKVEAKPKVEAAKGPEKPPEEAELKEAKAEPEAVEEKKASPSPEEDSRFQGVMNRLEKTSQREEAHEPAAKKVVAARSAAVPPSNDRSSRAQANQVEVMSQQEAKKPDKNDFLSMLRAELERIAPKNMEETENFKKEGKAGQLKSSLNAKVSQQKEDSAQDIKSATAAEPNPETVEAKEVLPIPKEPADPRQVNLRSKDVLPLPKKEEEISAEHNKKKAEDLMVENDIDEEQLKKANEPQFSDALKAKKELEEHADKVPETYRAEEQAFVTEAEADVKAQEKAAKDVMRAKRQKAKEDVKGRQQEAKKKEEEERKKVADEIQRMYETTKTKVEEKLNSLDGEVNCLFDDGEKRARGRFESHVDRRMSAYKWDRYINKIGGGLLWAKDKIFGMPDKVNRFYEEGRDLYIKDMDAVLVKIADTVETRLKEAKDEITKGKEEIRKYVEDLPKNLQKAGKEAEKNVSSEFDELEEGVEAKKQDLAQKMAQRYKESREKLDERIEELKKENQGFLDSFIGKIKEIIEILRNFKERIMSLMRKGADAVRQIVKDPGKFLGNLIDAIKLGFNQFADNFMKHLKKGFMSWLFGTMTEAGIEMPSEFSFKSVFGLILQILGITKERIRAKVVRLIGPRNVARIEKAWSIVSTLISGGVGGLWEKAKEYLSDLKEKLFSEMQDWLITQIVKQALLWVVSLFNPVSALLKIIKMVYDVIMFFVENIERILKLVEAVVQSVSKIVAGQIGAAANWIENAMSRIVPIIISFLARLLGMSGISRKIKSFIKAIQKKVSKAIDKVLKKIVGGIKKLIGKGKVAAKKVAKKVKELIFPKKRFKVGKETHSVEAIKSGKKHKIIIRSQKYNVPPFVKLARDKEKENPKPSLKNQINELEGNYNAWKKMGEKTDAKKEGKAKEYSRIAGLIATIMNEIGSDKPVKDSKITWDYPDTEGRTRGVKADPLTVKKGNSEGGSPPKSGEHPKGWKERGQAPEPKKGLIRAHLLHHRLHGPGTVKNLTPTSSGTNQLMYNRVEKHALMAIKSNRALTYVTKVEYDDNEAPPLKHFAKRIKMTAKDKEKNTVIGSLSVDNY